jgi:hypothetical protein
MGDTKRRTTIYIDPDIHTVIRLRGINLSSLVEDLLSSYLATNDINSIRNKIAEHQSMIRTLEKQQANLVKSSMANKQQNVVTNQIMTTLKVNFEKRRQHGQVDPFEYLSNPKFISRCKLMGRDPQLVLGELESWYQEKSKQKDLNYLG